MEALIILAIAGVILLIVLFLKKYIFKERKFDIDPEYDMNKLIVKVKKNDKKNEADKKSISKENEIEKKEDKINADDDEGK